VHPLVLPGASEVDCAVRLQHVVPETDNESESLARSMAAATTRYPTTEPNGA
jgi:hypothetical protein